jgi:hypothetical protein
VTDSLRDAIAAELHRPCLRVMENKHATRHGVDAHYEAADRCAAAARKWMADWLRSDEASHICLGASHFYRTEERHALADALTKEGDDQ